MADTCIVCLGDLATSDPPVPAVEAEDADPLAPRPTSVPTPIDDATIAHLLPCKHNLHNTCLKPWVERANSCPICRTDFNMVELRASLNGPCIESYAVQDKKQTAAFDPSDFLLPDDVFSLNSHYDDDAARGNCLVCRRPQDEEDLLLCDGCNATTHTYCCGLTSVPPGSWFCEFCQEDGTADSHLALPGSNAARNRQQQRSRAHRRAARRRQGQSDYTRVWQTVLARTNIDLDFPFEDDAGPSLEALVHRRGMNEWTRRLQIAERQGSAARFRETAGTLLHSRSSEPIDPPAAEAVEEAQAWTAFERAREPVERTSGASTPRGRKRKSATASPAEPEESVESERRLKRPRTHRVQDTAASSRTNATPVAPAAATAPSADAQTLPQAAPEAPVQGPSFLRQLLTEVQNSATSSDQARSLRDPMTTNTPQAASPGPASPTYSPVTSNHPSPRLRSASPHSPHSSRPSSPSPGLTSRIEPIFVQRHPSAFSPISPSERVGKSPSPAPSNGRASRSRQRPKSPPFSGSEDDDKRQAKDRRKSAAEGSPTRGADLSFDEKSRVQKMVSAALKPLYRSKELDTEQYTEINKNVSRMMYDKIAQAGGLHDAHQRWAGVAMTEVESAVKSLRDSAITATANVV